MRQICLEQFLVSMLIKELEEQFAVDFRGLDIA
eukprot:COSAG02_NODE_51316_length_315_cov_0.435185_1_plen_32_part_01